MPRGKCRVAREGGLRRHATIYCTCQRRRSYCSALVQAGPGVPDPALRKTGGELSGGRGLWCVWVGARGPSSAAAHLRLAPTASGSGTWPVFIDPRSQTRIASLASRSRAEQGHGHPHPSAGRSGRSGARHATGTGPALRRAGWHGESERHRPCTVVCTCLPWLAFWFRCPDQSERRSISS
jgi:hypothetical protein